MFPITKATDSTVQIMLHNSHSFFLGFTIYFSSLWALCLSFSHILHSVLRSF
jgi:cytochrome c biogenesis protein CcdA